MARKHGTNTGIPGMSFSAKRTIARKTGIPTTRSGRQRKYGKMASGGCMALIVQVLTLSLLLGFVKR